MESGRGSERASDDAASAAAAAEAANFMRNCSVGNFSGWGSRRWKGGGAEEGRGRGQGGRGQGGRRDRHAGHMEREWMPLPPPPTAKVFQRHSNQLFGESIFDGLRGSMNKRVEEKNFEKGRIPPRDRYLAIVLPATHGDADLKRLFYSLSADELDVGIGICGWIMTAVSWLLVLVTLPFSLFFCFKVSHGVTQSILSVRVVRMNYPSGPERVCPANDGVQLALGPL